MPLLEYSKWENFHKVIKRAMIACETSKNNDFVCFPEVRKPIISGKGRESFVVDYNLNRYACYLIAQNANPRKKSAALGQTYFAIQTRKMELLKRSFLNFLKMKKDYTQELMLRLKTNFYLILLKNQV